MKPNRRPTRFLPIAAALLAAAVAVILAVWLLRSPDDRPASAETSVPASSAPSVSSEVASAVSSDLSSAVSSAPAPTGTIGEAAAAAAGLDRRTHGYGFGYPDGDPQNRPSEALYNQRTYGSAGMLCLTEDTDTIYLTMDEGYEAGYTVRILDILKEKNCTATFFVTGAYVRERPDLVRRMIAEGHTVGNHSVNHPDLTTLDPADAAREILGLHETVRDTFGYEMHLFRPPMGRFSPATLAVTKALGYRTVEWSFAYEDYDEDKQPAPDKAKAQILGATHGGGIFLLHACSSTNTEILGELIDAWRAKGYAVKALPNTRP